MCSVASVSAIRQVKKPNIVKILVYEPIRACPYPFQSVQRCVGARIKVCHPADIKRSVIPPLCDCPLKQRVINKKCNDALNTACFFFKVAVTCALLKITHEQGVWSASEQTSQLTENFKEFLEAYFNVDFEEDQEQIESRLTFSGVWNGFVIGFGEAMSGIVRSCTCKTETQPQ